MTALRLFSLLLLATLLLACSADTELPPERPAGIVSGKVVDGVVSGAQVTVYAFGDGVRGKRLGGATTDAEGNYSLEIQAPSQLILIETSGGSYIEQATGTVVTVSGGDVMRAITRYESGEAIDTVVTPLTQLVAGLTSYKVNQGAPAEQAYNDAKTTIEQFFTVDTANTVPVDITQAGNTVNAVSEEALYGFYLAAISNWSLWVSNKNRVAPHTIYTSIGMTQIMYNDVESDGVLDGIGFNLARDNLMPLAVGAVALDTELYRAAFSLHMLAVSNMAGNTTNLKPGDLQLVAEDLATKSSELFSNADILDINSQLPLINLAQPLRTAYSGVMTLPIDIGGFLDAATISVSVDGSFVAEVADPQIPVVIIDTTNYPTDGDHVLTLSATDILDHTAAQNFTVRFDNTNPVINVTSSPVTNISSATISGTFSDNLAGVESIVVNGQPAVLAQGGNWSATVDIVPGENVIPISVFDFAGNQTDTQTTIFLDNIAPVIDTASGHGDARFSDGAGGYFTAPLQDNNASTALYIETNRLDLNGVPITRPELESNLIPYFAFTVSDERSVGNPTPFNELQIRIQYEKNGGIFSPWHLLPVPGTGNEYIVPLASETLAPGWDQASQNETHQILLEVSDPAGNMTTSSFSFRADFYVPALDIGSTVTTDLGTELFSTTAFADRANLNNMQFASTEFATIVNPVNTSIYIRPEDTATHSVSQTVQQLVREHQVRLITSPQWQMRLMTTTQQCPGDNAASWQNVSSVYNWINGGWTLEAVPLPTPGAIEFAPDDNLPDAPAPSIWSDLPDFDNEFNFRSINIGGGRSLNFYFDYVVDIANLLPPAAYVSNWEIRNASDVVIATCPDTSFIQQREVYTYQSEPGYPQPVISDVELSGLPGFSSTGFEVFDNDAAAIIQPVSGWYNIPAGHSVTVTKYVTTPPLVNYNDDISNPNSATYTPRLNDHAISWFVNREIVLSVIHDAGEPRIPDMSQHVNPIGNGFMTYQISR